MICPMLTRTMFYTNLPEDQDVGELANRRQVMVECLGEKCAWWGKGAVMCAVAFLAEGFAAQSTRRDRAIDNYEDSH